MRRFYFHLRDGSDQLLDPEGVELSQEAIPAAALASARDCMAGDVHRGRLDLRYRIDIEDEAGRIVHSCSFTDALEVIPPD